MEVSAKPKEVKRDPNAPPEYTGNRVTFNFQDIPARSELQLIADMSDLNIVVADSDGVAVVPRAQAQIVLTTAQQMDYKEHSMYAVIEQLKSIVQAVKKFGRL